jgi:hypothetical protein
MGKRAKADLKDEDGQDKPPPRKKGKVIDPFLYGCSSVCAFSMVRLHAAAALTYPEFLVS